MTGKKFQNNILEHRLESVSALIRLWMTQMTSRAQSGHLSSSLSAVELMVALMFGGIFRFDLRRPQYQNNDRLIFSKGHASPLFYALWAAAGGVNPKKLDTFRQFDSELEGHPGMRFSFTEAPTGSLGQGLSIGVGEALYAEHVARLPYRTYVLLGDSELAEGSNWEAIQLAAHYRLRSLTGIIDVNRLGQRGETMYGHNVSAYRRRIAAFGWNTHIVDGHSLVDLLRVYRRSLASARPTMIIARTIKGKGISFMENKNGWHGKALYPEQYRRALIEFPKTNSAIRGTVVAPLNRKARRLLHNPSVMLSAPHRSMSIREACGLAVAQAGKRNQRIVVLDAEVSNSTKFDVCRTALPSRFFEMFIAEQNMVGVAVGMARRGMRPVISTFAAFFTRAVDQIRMAQYAAVPLLCIGSHPGVAIGKDGPSQMALEDISLFRSLHNSVVLYPGDAISARQLVRLALQQSGITYVRSTRSTLPPVYSFSSRFRIGGSHTLRRSKRDQITIVAAGVTLHQALSAYDELRSRYGVWARVIDVYSIKPLDQPTLRRALKETRGMIVVEDHYLAGGIGESIKSALYGSRVPIVSLAVTKMPRSGPPERLLAYEGIDKRAIIQAALTLV